MSTGDALSEAALAISLVALVISVMQALQQYFSTAEGFRQCREDVMGKWSALTESPLDLRNLRYETKFVSPCLMLVPPTQLYEKQSDRLFKDGKDNRILPVGHRDLPEGTKDRGKLASARVTWLALLEHIESYQRGVYNSAFDDVRTPKGDATDPEKGKSRTLSMDEWFQDLHDRKESRMSFPAAYKREVSWDFMPPEAMKPFATISLHDLLVLGYRLGLDSPYLSTALVLTSICSDIGTDVNPQEDRLVAQDDSGNDISAARIRGLGLMVQFQHDSGRSQLDRSAKSSGLPIKQFNLKDLMVPSLDADKLAFGVIPGDTQLGFDDVIVNTLEDCLNYAGSLNASDQYSKSARERLQASFDKGDRSKSGLDQLMPLISPCLVLPGCRTTRVRRPNEWCHVGIMEVMEGFVVYRDTIDDWRKSESISAERRSTLKFIQDRWARLRDNCKKPLVWAAFRDQVPASYLSSETSDVHSQCTKELVIRSAELLKMIDKYLTDTHKDYVPPAADADERRPMQIMLEFHIFRALGLRERAEKIPREQVDTHDLKFPDAPMFCQMMKFQLDDIHELCEDVVKSILGREYNPLVESEHHEQFEKIVAYASDIWLIWIFRGLVFNRSCTFDVPRRSGAGGKQYSLIPSQWLYSQIPIHIS